MKRELVIVMDFGGQYNQLVARRVRECNVYCEIYSYKTPLEKIKEMNPKGIILTGGPNSCYLEDSPTYSKELFELGIPVLGLCYGAQLMQHVLGGKVERADVREYGKSILLVDQPQSKILKGVPETSTVWMSHFDYISKIAPGFEITTHTKDCPVASCEDKEKDLYAIQFHPEVLHSEYGKTMLSNFVLDVCNCAGDWRMDSFVEEQIKAIKEKVGNGKVLCALSGGVDSSVAAYLMKEAGYDCIGVTMKLYDNEDIGMAREKTCCSLSDIEDARSVCVKLGIPYYVFNFKDDFKEKVIDNFISCYQNGMTPNPCIECNRHLKFEHLYKRAKVLHCDVIVTGHYAKITHDEQGYHLLKGVDDSKDQSYVLYSLTQEQLANTCFPLGDYSKTEIRKIAEEQGFFNAHKHDSQDICFIPDGDYMSFIEKTTGKKSEPGDFVNQEGEVVGRHKGYYGYTIGQRKGLGISAPKPYYVTEIRPEENKVIVGSNEDLFKTDLIANDFNWIENLAEDEVVKARIRYHQTEKEATARKNSDGTVDIHFLEPQRAITKGQAVVLYRDNHVVGGGTIIK